MCMTATTTKLMMAALSGCNSGMYSSGRMLYTLAQNGQAPKIFAKLSPSGVPRNSIAVTIVVLAIGVILNYLVPDSKLFLYLYSASVFPGMVAWFVLAYAQKTFRKSWGPEVMAKHPFKSPLYPYSNYFCIIFLILVTIGMIYNPDTRMSIFSSWVFIAAVMAACGVDLAELGEVVKQYLDQEYQSLKTEDGADPQRPARQHVGPAVEQHLPADGTLSWAGQHRRQRRAPATA